MEGNEEQQLVNQDLKNMILMLIVNKYGGVEEAFMSMKKEESDNLDHQDFVNEIQNDENYGLNDTGDIIRIFLSICPNENNGFISYEDWISIFDSGEGNENYPQEQQGELEEQEEYDQQHQEEQPQYEENENPEYYENNPDDHYRQPQVTGEGEVEDQGYESINRDFSGLNTNHINNSSRPVESNKNGADLKNQFSQILSQLQESPNQQSPGKVYYGQNELTSSLQSSIQKLKSSYGSGSQQEPSSMSSSNYQEMLQQIKNSQSIEQMAKNCSLLTYQHRQSNSNRFSDLHPISIKVQPPQKSQGSDQKLQNLQDIARSIGNNPSTLVKPADFDFNSKNAPFSRPLQYQTEKTNFQTPTQQDNPQPYYEDLVNPHEFIENEKIKNPRNTEEKLENNGGEEEDSEMKIRANVMVQRDYKNYQIQEIQEYSNQNADQSSRQRINVTSNPEPATQSFQQQVNPDDQATANMNFENLQSDIPEEDDARLPDSQVKIYHQRQKQPKLNHSPSSSSQYREGSMGRNGDGFINDATSYQRPHLSARIASAIGSGGPNRAANGGLISKNDFSLQINAKTSSNFTQKKNLSIFERENLIGELFQGRSSLQFTKETITSKPRNTSTLQQKRIMLNNYFSPSPRRVVNFGQASKIQDREVQSSNQIFGTSINNGTSPTFNNSSLNQFNFSNYNTSVINTQKDRETDRQSLNPSSGASSVFQTLIKASTTTQPNFQKSINFNTNQSSSGKFNGALSKNSFIANRINISSNYTAPDKSNTSSFFKNQNSFNQSSTFITSPTNSNLNHIGTTHQRGGQINKIQSNKNLNTSENQGTVQKVAIDSGGLDGLLAKLSMAQIQRTTGQFFQTQTKPAVSVSSAAVNTFSSTTTDLKRRSIKQLSYADTNSLLRVTDSVSPMKKSQNKTNELQFNLDKFRIISNKNMFNINTKIHNSNNNTSSNSSSNKGYKSFTNSLKF